MDKIERLKRQNFISVDLKMARSSYGEYFIIGELVNHQDKEVGEAIINRFEIVTEMNEIKVYTTKGYAYLDFLVKKI